MIMKRSLIALAFLAVPAWAQVTQTNQPAPTWVAWNVFYGSLAARADADKILAAQFGLTPAQATTLLKAGQAYTTAIQGIVTDTQAEVKRRYMPVASGNKPPATNMK